MAFIEFKNINYLYIGIIVLIGSLILYLMVLKRKKYLAKELSTSLVLKKVIKKKTIKENLISILLLLVLLLLFVALADPMIRMKSEKEGVNVVLVIDKSGSMMVNDFKPDRMESAKTSAINFIEEMSPKDYIGAVSFSDTTQIVSFLTNDRNKVIDKIKTINAGGGTAIGDGLAMGIDMVTSIPNRKKLIILLSDGEQTAGKISVDDAIMYAKNENVVVYTIGVGSNQNIILGYDFFGRPQYAKLDEKTLKKIAEETGGKYYRAKDEVDLNEIYKNLPKVIKKEKELVSIKDWIIKLEIILMIIVFCIKYWNKVKIW